MTKITQLRLVLAATFALQVGGMIAYWPPQPPPALPPPEHSYDLNILYDPPTSTAPGWCHPVQDVLEQCPTVLR